MKLTVLISTLAISFTSHGASFDCTKASSEVEKIICQTPSLSTLDDTLAKAYSNARSKSADIEKLKSEQINWIKNTRQCKNDIECITNSYKKRIAELEPNNTQSDEIVASNLITNTQAAAQSTAIAQNTQASVPPITTDLDKNTPPSISEQNTQPPENSQLSTTATEKSSLITSEAEKPSIINYTTNKFNEFFSGEQTPFYVHALWALGYLSICAAIAYITEMQRRERLKAKVNEKYGSTDNLGKFTDNKDFIEKSLTSDERASAKEIEIIKTFITISKPFTQNNGNWHMERGHFNSAAYNSAYNSYQTQLQSWQIGEAAFRQQEEIQKRRADAMKQTYFTRSYPVPKPTAPSEYSFVSYSSDYGSCSASLQHSIKLTSLKTEFHSEKLSKIEIDPNKFFKPLFDIYGDLFSKIYSGNVAVNIAQEILGFARMDEPSIVKFIEPEIVAGLIDQVKQLMYKYDRNPSITNYQYTITPNSIDFPIAIIILKISENTHKLIICDADEPEIVIYR